MDFVEYSNVLGTFGIEFSPQQLEDVVQLCEEQNRPVPNSIEEFVDFYYYLQDSPFLKTKLEEIQGKRKQPVRPPEAPAVNKPVIAHDNKMPAEHKLGPNNRIPHELQDFYQRSPVLIQKLLEMDFPAKFIAEAVKRFSSLEACVEYIFQLMSQTEQAQDGNLGVAPAVKTTIFAKEVEQDCGICFTPYPVSELLTLSCDHRLCTDCFAGNCNSKISDAQVQEDQLCCPCLLDDGATICKRPIDVYILRANLPEALIEKYDRFITREFCESQHLCRCPQCNDWFVDVSLGESSAEVRIWKSITCQGCQHMFCGRCGQPPHRGQRDQDITCEQYAKWKEEQDHSEDRLQDYMRENRVFACPGCKHGIERNDGCKFMTCSKCKTKSCNLCGVKLLESQHYSHFTNGPFGEVCKGPADGAN